MNLRKAAIEYLKYVDQHGIRRVHEVFPRWLRDNHKDIYRSVPAMLSLEKVLHKNDRRYRELPASKKAEVRARRKDLYNEIALSIFRPKRCLECGEPIVLKTSGPTPIPLATAVHPPKFCSVQCSSTSSLTKAKTKVTNMERYGTTCTLNTKQSIRKKHATWKRKYGVINPSHSPEVVGKILRSRYGHKTKTIKGKTFTYQGYEHVLLTYLVRRIGVSVDFLTTSPGKVKMFDYTYLGKTLKYLPDIKARLPNGRLWYFEVKSLLTLNSSRSIRDRVYAKACAMWDLGKLYSVVLCDNKKILGKANNPEALRRLFKEHQNW